MLIRVMMDLFGSLIRCVCVVRKLDGMPVHRDGYPLNSCVEEAVFLCGYRLAQEMHEKKDTIYQENINVSTTTMFMII